MRNEILFSLFLLVSSSASSQILNAGFEDWTNGNPDSWVTSNIQIASFTNVTQTSDVNSGSSAAYGIVASLNNMTVPPLIQGGTGGGGFSISERYASVQLFYKFLPVGGDHFSVNVNFEKNGNVIAQGSASVTATMNSYTALTVPLTYSSSAIPDIAFIQITISGPNGTDHHVGSEMFVDDLSFSGISAPGENQESESVISFSPNPAIDMVSVSFENQDFDQLEILDLAGNSKLKLDHLTQKSTGQQVHFSVSDLPPGVYFYSLSNKALCSKGKFIVLR